MSTLIVDVTPVINIIDHPNADRLSIATVKGWNVVTAKKEDGTHRYNVGDLVVYCPIDSVLPEELSDRLEVTKYLSKGRVKTAKLRGFYSQGLIIPLHFLGGSGWKEGDDVKEVLNIIKYHIVAASNSGEMLQESLLFVKYTNIENIKNYPDVLKEGESVVISEKIHGSNFRAAKLNDGTFLVGSHNTNRARHTNNVYWNVAIKYDLENILEPGQQVFGEIFGSGVQKLQYGLKNKIDLALFDLIDGGMYVDNVDFVEFCVRSQLPIVPKLWEGEWSKDMLKLGDGQTTIEGGKHIREGFVVKPVKERLYMGNRVIFKHISERYLMKDYD